MATTLTRNLKLRVDSNLTANAKYNLERIDTLGSTFIVDTTDQLNIRSKTNILLEPESADIGGSGDGGILYIGSASHSLDSVFIYTDALNISQSLGLLDQASGGTKYLRLGYKSDIAGSIDTSADRSLLIDLQGANRNLVLGGDLTTDGGSLTLNMTGASSVIVPITGTLATLAGTEVLTNKTIDADQNTLLNIRNASIATNAGIAYSKLNLSNSIVNADVSSSAAIAYSKLALSNSIVNADIATGAAIARSKIASGTANHVIINNGSGLLSSEEFLATSRGGTGVSGSAIYPDSGIVATDGNTLTLTNKTINGSLNTLTNVAYSSLVLTGSITNADVNPTAGIVYSKLNLASSILNADIASGAGIVYSKLNLTGSILNADVNAAAAIAYSKLALANSIVNADISGSAAISGTKISPDFGSQNIATTGELRLANGSAVSTLEASPSQVLDINYVLPAVAPTTDQVLRSTSTPGVLEWATVAGSGTVTSVALTMPSAIFDVAGSPITGSGTLAVTLDNQTANTVFSGPSSGVPAAPTFRTLVINDLPNSIPQSKLDLLQFEDDWDNADGTTKVVTHSLGSTDVDVSLIDLDDGQIIGVDSIVVTDSNTITLSASEAPGTTWRVVIQAN